MTLQTITLARPLVLPQNSDCECCAGHLADALREREGVADVVVNSAQVVLQIDAARVPSGDAERLAREAGLRVAERYDHPVFAVEGMDCADCARTVERAIGRMSGVHYANVNFTAARLRLEYDREQTSVAAIEDLARSLGYGLKPPQRAGDLASQPAQGVAPDGSAWSSLLSHPRDMLTTACGLLIVAAWLSGWLGAPPALATALYVLATLAGALFVARSGWATLLATHTLDINLLMTIAAAGALLIGEYAEGAAVVFLFALGNTLEGYTMDRARRSIRALMQLAPTMARVLRTEPDAHAHTHDAEAHDEADAQDCSIGCSCGEVLVPIGNVLAGEVIVVRPGDRVPLDALVLSGESAVDQAPITGESVPVAKAVGATLFAGSINGEGALEARVTRPAEDSTLARIIHMVEEAQAQKSRAQRFIDVFAAYYTPAVIALAVLVAILPPLLAGGAWAIWFYRALVLLVIACPCALVISTPVSIVSAISAAARAGVLFKGGAALEAAGGLRAIAFDKTGTLTAGKPIVTDVVNLIHEEHKVTLMNHEQQDSRSFVPFVDSDDLLALAAAVERRSSHPLARAIVAAAEQRGLDLPAASEFQSRGGRGASAIIGGKPAAIGNRAMFESQALGAEIAAQLDELERAGRTAMLVSYDEVVAGIIAVADQPRAESQATVAALKRQGIAHVAMLTGDAAPVAAQIGAATGVDEVRAELLPDHKLAAIGELLERHGQVAMVGDGVNDAPALARATVGIAMGAAGSDAALETADVTLMADDLSKLPFAIGLSRAARRVILQNIVFALAVKALFLVATLLGAATLWMAVFADTGAALIVIANGMRLLRYRP